MTPTESRVREVMRLALAMGDARAAAVMDFHSETRKYEFRASRAALESAVRALAAPVVPPGWALVPIEPTQEMCAAAVVYANGNAVYKNVAAEALKIEEAIYGEAYAAMLAAAPPASEA